jgi:hypothetical protein
MYTLGEDSLPLEGKKEDPASLMKKYRQKLKKLEKVFFTAKAKKIATKHQLMMDEYFEEFMDEIDNNYKKGSQLAKKYCHSDETVGTAVNHEKDFAVRKRPK